MTIALATKGKVAPAGQQGIALATKGKVFKVLTANVCETDAPTWDTTTGIQTLLGKGSHLTMTWNAATDSQSPPTQYAIYIRDGSAPDAFGDDSAYFHSKTENTDVDIYTEADNKTRLKTTSTYHVIVRASDQQGNSETNTTSLSATLTASNGLGWLDLEKIIVARFQAQVVDIVTPAIPVHYDNDETKKPSDGSRWVRATVIEGEPDFVELGRTKTTREVGLFVVSIFTPVNEGPNASLSVADTTAKAFRLIKDTGVTFNTPAIRKIGRSGKYWQVNVECPFYSDLQTTN